MHARAVRGVPDGTPALFSFSLPWGDHHGVTVLVQEDLLESSTVRECRDPVVVLVKDVGPESVAGSVGPGVWSAETAVVRAVVLTTPCLAGGVVGVLLADRFFCLGAGPVVDVEDFLLGEEPPVAKTGVGLGAKLPAVGVRLGIGSPAGIVEVVHLVFEQILGGVEAVVDEPAAVDGVTLIGVTIAVVVGFVADVARVLCGSAFVFAPLDQWIDVVESHVAVVDTSAVVATGDGCVQVFVATAVEQGDIGLVGEAIAVVVKAITDLVACIGALVLAPRLTVEINEPFCTLVLALSVRTAEGHSVDGWVAV